MIDWTATLRGVTVGAGTAYRWASMPTGLLGYSELRVGDVPIPRADGVFAGDDRLGGRTIVFDVHILGTSRTSAETAAAALAGAWSPSRVDVELGVRLSGTPAEYSLFGRPRGCDIAIDRKMLAGVLRARCTFLATDPRRFGALVNATLALPSGTSGLPFPAAAPFVWGAGSGGNVSVNQAGTVDTDWTATISGPITTPRIEHVELGRSLAVNLSLAAGETLVLDSRSKSILLNGTASRYSSLTSGSRWFQLPPGTSTVRLTGAGGSGSAQFSYRPAYL